MRKNKMFSALLLCFIFVNAFADQTKLVKLNNKDHKKEIVSLPFCNLFIEMTEVDEKDFSVSVNIENVSEINALCLFNRAYNEKVLKSMSIVYDKVFQGKKGKRIAESCEGLQGSVCILPGSDTKKLLSIKGSDKTLIIRLPIYIARYNKSQKSIFKKNRISLAQKEIIELNIDVELKPDEEYLKLTEATNLLIEEIEKQTFCSNKNHRGTSYNTLIKVYDESIVDLKRQIANVIRTRGYMSSDKGYKQFIELHNRLNSIKLEDRVVASCGNDKAKKKQGHNCKYCDVSYAMIYNKLEGYYIDIHNGKRSKAQIIGDVETLYNCVIKNKKRSDNGNYLSRIKTYYNKIKTK